MLATLGRRTVLGSRLDLRAQAGRRAGPGLPARGSGRAVVAQPQAPDRDLPRDRRRAWLRPARRRPGDRRRDRGLRPVVGPASAACSSASAWTGRRASRSPVAVAYLVFDVLVVDGRRLTDRAPGGAAPGCWPHWCVRGTVVALNGAFAGDGEALFAEMCARGWEGVVAKRAAERLPVATFPGLAQDQVRATPGVRGGRLHRAPGPTAGTGCAADRACTRATGCATPARWAPASPTGVLTQLRDRLDGLEQDRRRSAADRIPERTATGCGPSWWPRCRFSEWTADGRLRHPAFVGLRDDKDPPRSCASDRVLEQGGVDRYCGPHAAAAPEPSPELEVVLDAAAACYLQFGVQKTTAADIAKRGRACRGPRSTAATAATRRSSWPC